VVRLRPAAAVGATGVDQNQRSAARATPCAAEDARQEMRSSVGSDRPSDRIGRLGPSYPGRGGPAGPKRASACLTG
jgi:hypothetical protein